MVDGLTVGGPAIAGVGGVGPVAFIGAMVLGFLRVACSFFMLGPG